MGRGTGAGRLAWRRGVVPWLMALTSAWAAAAGVAAPAEVPGGPLEMEFWRSAQRIHTADAYRAYLGSYPQGVFAALARAALARLQDTPAAPAAPLAPVAVTVPPAPVTPAQPPATAPASLRHFSAPASGTGALDINLGDRYVGPGALTLGGLGARKQLVLPAGDWTVLAAVDRASSQVGQSAPVRVGITTVALGRFEGVRLATLLVYTASNQVFSLLTWPDLVGCQSARGGAPLQLQRSQAGLRDDCLSQRVDSDGLARVDPAARQELRASLSTLGAQVWGVGVVSTLTLTERRLGYYALQRIDWPAATLGPQVDDWAQWLTPSLADREDLRRFAQRQFERLSRARPALALGFGRDLDLPDLGPDVPGPSSPALAALADDGP